ncbi:MAG: response regulator transcription factor [Winogradskyella sp.]|nr:response regulator transcription factor [Winogradskyella sp.]NNK39348.1 response regulator transcription factor [Winogradskyella sp.]NNL83521.1 response regulator transcription factor [Winogradskyella sp.]
MKILVIDDHAILRKGILSILKKEFKDSIYFEASNGIEALSILRNIEMDLIVSDIAMPNLNGIDFLKQLKAMEIKSPVLILSVMPEDQYALRALKAGAVGFLPKDCKAKELLKAVKTILSGKKYITPAISNLMINSIGVKQINNQHELLSDREIMVLHNIAQGHSLTDISENLGLSINTVSTYRARIIKKLNLKNNASIIRYALDNDLG